jgi:hypothetical protein
MRRRPTPAVLLLAATAIAPALAAQVPAGAGSRPATRFTVRIENVSTTSTLPLSSGGAMAILLSPVVWAVHTAGNPLLTPGQLEPGLGLEGLAEAGMARPFAAKVKGVAGVSASGVANKPAVAMPKAGQSREPASPLLDSGYQFEFVVEARPGDRLSFALMLGPSNDGLVATGAEGIALFDASGRPVSGDVTAMVSLWDAGTEVNEEPGLGPNQGLRQSAPHAGDPERRPVRPMSDAEFGSLWPPPRHIVKVTLDPAPKQP